MEEDAIETRALHPTPQLLNLIRDERACWTVALGEAEDGIRRQGITISDAEEEEDSCKLELKLGLPDVVVVQGEDGGQKIEQQHEEDTALSLGRFPAHHPPKPGANTKRGFFATAEAKPQAAGRCCNQRRQDREAGRENELTLGGGGEPVAGESRKKGCCPPSSSHDSAARPMRSSTNPHRSGAAPPVVGWPPVRSFRRNLTNGSSSKQSPERQNGEAADKAKIDPNKRSSLVKINMDGIPIGRKVNLAAYDSFQELSSAVEELFRGFLEAQKDLACDQSREHGAGEKMFSGLLDGTGEYTLVYEDNRGGRTLARDLPWSVFASTAKRIWVMRSSELPHGLIKKASERVADN